MEKQRDLFSICVRHDYRNPHFQIPAQIFASKLDSVRPTTVTSLYDVCKTAFANYFDMYLRLSDLTRETVFQCS